MIESIREFFTNFVWRPFGFKEISGAEAMMLLRRDAAFIRAEAEKERQRRLDLIEQSREQVRKLNLNRGGK